MVTPSFSADAALLGVSPLDPRLRAGPELPTVDKTGAGTADVRRAGKEFEAVFVRMLLDRMVPEGELFGSGPSAGVVRSLFVDGVASSLAERRSLGIAGLVERSMARGLPPSVSQAGGPEREPARSKE